VELQTSLNNISQNDLDNNMDLRDQTERDLQKLKDLVLENATIKLKLAKARQDLLQIEFDANMSKKSLVTSRLEVEKSTGTLDGILKQGQEAQANESMAF